MEAVSTSRLAGELSTASLGEEDHSLDNVVRKLAGKKVDDLQYDGADESSLMPIFAHTLPQPLLTLREGKKLIHRPSNDQPLVREITITQYDVSRTERLARRLSSARGVADSAKAPALQSAQINARSSSVLELSSLSAESSDIVSGHSALAKSDTDRVTVRALKRSDGRGVEIPSVMGSVSGMPITGSESLPSLVMQKDTREKRVREGGEGAAGLQTSLANRGTVLRELGEQKINMSSPSSFAAQGADVSVKQPNGLIYRFTRWGAEHTVTVQGATGGNLLLQPSDSVVTQQLSEQWQSGHPQKWQLARDGGEERNPHQQQYEDEET